MDIGPNHWIFAGVFAFVFIIGIIFAYRQDIAKTPNLFQGSSKFLLGVVVFLMVVIVIKMLSKLGN